MNYNNYSNNNIKPSSAWPGKGFALIEILIAITILSISLVSIISGVSAGIIAISGNKNLTKAMIIARSKLYEFEMVNMRGPDISEKEVEEYQGFTYSREIKRFEHALLGPLNANRVMITVQWQERGRDKNYSLSYIYPTK